MALAQRIISARLYLAEHVRRHVLLVGLAALQ
jgi:hypothetical protein